MARAKKIINNDLISVIDGIKLYGKKEKRGHIKLNKKLTLEANVNIFKKSSFNTEYKKLLKQLKGRPSTLKTTEKIVKKFFEKEKENIKQINIKNLKQWRKQTDSYLEDTNYKSKDYKYFAKNFYEGLFSRVPISKSREIKKVFNKYGLENIGRIMKAISQYQNIEIQKLFFNTSPKKKDGEIDYIQSKSETFLSIKNSLQNIANNLIDKDRETLEGLINSLTQKEIL